MFTEEVGVSPVAGDGGSLYRARVAELIGQGRSFARIEDGVVVFKAEIGAATTAACQVQGVWVNPDHRGRGLGVAGTAAVVEQARRQVAPIVSLYVNDYNAAGPAGVHEGRLPRGRHLRLSPVLRRPGPPWVWLASGHPAAPMPRRRMPSGRDGTDRPAAPASITAHSRFDARL